MTDLIILDQNLDFCCKDNPHPEFRGYQNIEKQIHNFIKFWIKVALYWIFEYQWRECPSQVKTKD